MDPATMFFVGSPPGTIRVTLVFAVTGPVIEKLPPFQTSAVLLAVSPASAEKLLPGLLNVMLPFGAFR